MVGRCEAADPFRRSYALTEGAVPKKKDAAFFIQGGSLLQDLYATALHRFLLHPKQKTPPLSGVLVIRYFFSMRRFAASMVSVRVPFFISTFSPWKSSPVSSSSRPPISVPF